MASFGRGGFGNQLYYDWKGWGGGAGTPIRTTERALKYSLRGRAAESTNLRSAAITVTACDDLCHGRALS
jgi:hypothetical protein